MSGLERIAAVLRSPGRVLVPVLISCTVVHASGIRYEKVSLRKAVAESVVIVQAEYLGEDEDDYGPHAKYRLTGVVRADGEVVSELKVWAAHADEWGLAMRLVEETGEHNWFMVPEYQGADVVAEPVVGETYVLLLDRLDRETDFAFHVEGGLLEETLLKKVRRLAARDRAEPEE